MATIYDFATAWSKTIPSGGDDNARKRYQSVNVWYSGRTIYSYGEHFPMAYIIAPNLVWFNGDRFSVSTNNHQSELRAAIRRNAPDATVVIVPRTALEAAGADYKTIAPVDVKPERWEHERQTAATPPADMLPVGEDAYSRGAWGASWERDDSPAVVGYVNRDGSRQSVRRLEDGTYAWHTARHWLGDSVFTAEQDPWRTGSNERRYYVSSFDRQERRPLYFLSQLPGPVDTFESAIESLAPDSVKTARELGRDVVRQGDMFAIAMQTTTRELRAAGATFEKRRVTVRLREFALANVAQRELLETLAADMPARPVWSGEWAERQAHRDAEDAWKADLVARYDAFCQSASDAGRAPFPDFLHASRVSTWSVDSAMSYRTDNSDKIRTVTGTALYGTAHTATEVATLPDGRQFARGTMYHEPGVIGQSRAADHRRQPLGKAWHLVARNTVPVSGTGRGRVAA